MALRGESSGGLLGEQARIPWKGGAGSWAISAWGLREIGVGAQGKCPGVGPGTPVSAPLSSGARPPPAGAGPWGRPSRACAPALLRAGERARSPGAGTRGGAKPGPLPPRAPMYAFYSLLIYIFYSLFRRDVGAKATADPKDPNQVSGGGLCRPVQRRSSGLAPRRRLCRGSLVLPSETSAPEGRCRPLLRRFPCSLPRLPAANPRVAAAPTSPLQNSGPS